MNNKQSTWNFVLEKLLWIIESQYLLGTSYPKSVQNTHSFIFLNAIYSVKYNHCGKNSVVARQEKDTDWLLTVYAHFAMKIYFV